MQASPPSYVNVHHASQYRIPTTYVLPENFPFYTDEVCIVHVSVSANIGFFVHMKA